MTVELSPASYRALATLLHRLCRLQLGADKAALLANRLRRRLRQLGLADFEAYVQLVESRAGANEREALVDLATTHHTSFFRDPAQFQFLREQILPTLGPALRRLGEPLRAWSAACASGEEAWSLAVVLAEAARRPEGCDWRVEASDIARPVLARARRAVYPQTDLAALDTARLHQWFDRGTGPLAGQVRPVAALRAKVHFRHLNLFGDYHPVAPDQHVIFCRNVMIYFDKASQQELARRLHDQLAPGGHLFLGTAETLAGFETPLVPVRQSVYRRPA
jgi:chemotaxis protein methyltransferase CheR